jgi:programmed cell death 6-interacting protein
LRSLNLPSSLEALERPIGLPPSFLKKAEEVRSEQGPERIETYLEHVELLARRAMAVLDEVWREHFLPVPRRTQHHPGDGCIGQ